MSSFLSCGFRLICCTHQACNSDSTANINIELINDSPFHLLGSFEGPQNSPYEGGYLEVVRFTDFPYECFHPPRTSALQDIVISPDYPFKPPEMKFITKVYHPNICSVSGAISLSILVDHWSPALTLRTTLLSLQSFLCDPDPRDPLDAEVAKVYMTYRRVFEDTARNWTRIYAKRPAQPPVSEDRRESGVNLRDESAVAGPHTAHVSLVPGQFTADMV